MLCARLLSYHNFQMRISINLNLFDNKKRVRDKISRLTIVFAFLVILFRMKTRINWSFSMHNKINIQNDGSHLRGSVACFKLNIFLTRFGTWHTHTHKHTACVQFETCKWQFPSKQSSEHMLLVLQCNVDTARERNKSRIVRISYGSKDKMTFLFIDEKKGLQQSAKYPFYVSIYSICGIIQTAVAEKNEYESLMWVECFFTMSLKLYTANLHTIQTHKFLVVFEKSYTRIESDAHLISRIIHMLFWSYCVTHRVLLLSDDFFACF